MVWLIAIFLFTLGILLGWMFHYHNREVKCPDGAYHDWEFVGVETVEKKECYTAHCEMGEFDVYAVTPVKCKKYRCKKCGYIKTEK